MLDVPTVTVRALTISAAAGGRDLLRDAELALFPGHLLAVTGPSGAGKTTLLRAITGHVPPGTTRTAGRVEVLGHDLFTLTGRDLRALRRQRIGFVGQDPGSTLNPRMRVRTLLTELAPPADRGRAAVGALLAEVHLPDDEGLTARRPGALSGGQQRRVAIARALARRPDVLLLDEPTAGLHPALREEVGELLRHLARTHRLAVAFSCHDTELVTRIADDVVELGITSRDRRSAAGPRPAATPGVGPPPAGAAAGTPVLAVQGVSATLGRPGRHVVALNRVDLSVAPGASAGLVGASGSGKTTLARAIVGLQQTSEGTITLDGRPLKAGLRGRRREQRRRIQLVTQNPLGALNPSRTIGAAIGRPLRLHRRCPPGDVPGRVAELLDHVGLPAEHAARYPHELSGGQRQRVAIARAIAADPDVLICDEVTSALDAATAEAIMDLLMDLRGRRDIALVLISHDLNLIADRTDTVTVLDAGRVAEAGPTGDVFSRPGHPATLALLARAHALR